MALPIGETPILKGKAATSFIKIVERDASRPVGPVPTPKLRQAHKVIREYAEQKQKQKQIH